MCVVGFVFYVGECKGRGSCGGCRGWSATVWCLPGRLACQALSVHVLAVCVHVVHAHAHSQSGGQNPQPTLLRYPNSQAKPGLTQQPWCMPVLTGFGVTAVAYSLKTIVDNSRTFGLFARCYQCPKNYLDYLTNPGNGL